MLCKIASFFNVGNVISFKNIYQNKRYYKKRKLQANITDEHRCKNPQQNSSKQNPMTYLKDHTS